MAKGKRSDNLSPRIVNRRATHDYHVEETLECGIVLVGSEVKSIRHGRVQLGDGFAQVDPKTLQLLLHNVDIALYPQAGPNQHTPKTTRKLLAHRREIAKLLGSTSVKGTTLIPLAMYFKEGRVKVEIGVATGKKEFDKRQDLRKKAAEKDMQRAMTRRTL